MGVLFEGTVLFVTDKAVLVAIVVDGVEIEQWFPISVIDAGAEDPQNWAEHEMVTFEARSWFVEKEGLDG